MIFRRDERGQILVLTALCMTILFGFMALAIDVGLLFNDKRKLQNAADAAATSAAIDYMFNTSQTTATAAANSAVTANQISGATVTVNYAPNITSSYHNTSSYIEVILTVPDPTFFMGMFNQKTVTVAARAVAGMPGRGNACVIVLDPHASSAMSLQGSFDVSADNCGVVVNSDASDALQFTGASGSLTAGYVSVVGGDGGHTGDSSPAPVTGAAPVINPFPSLSGPNPSTDCTAANTNTMSSLNSSTTYKTANNITCFSHSISMSGNVTLPSGVAVFESDVTLGGTVNSGTNGTTIDVYSGNFDVSTGTTLNLTAPTTAPTSSVPSGIAIMQPSSNTNTMKIQDGNSSGSLTGIVYAPGAQLFLNDSGGDHSGGTCAYNTDLIVGTFYDKTATLTINSYTTSFGSSSPLTAVALVE